MMIKAYHAKLVQEHKRLEKEFAATPDDSSESTQTILELKRRMRQLREEIMRLRENFDA